MRKFFFWLLVFLSTVATYQIFRLLSLDFKRINEYGWGYVTGLTCASLTVMVLAVLLGKSIYTSKGRP